MREIKFQAKIIRTGKWFQGELEDLIWNCPLDVDFFEYYDKESFSEFTYKHDFNNNEIYEGMILFIPKMEDEINEFLGVVKFNEELSCWTVENQHSFIRFSEIYPNLTEIRGDIIDNPELLEV